MTEVPSVHSTSIMWLISSDFIHTRTILRSSIIGNSSELLDVYDIDEREVSEHVVSSSLRKFSNESLPVDILRLFFFRSLINLWGFSLQKLRDNSELLLFYVRNGDHGESRLSSILLQRWFFFYLSGHAVISPLISVFSTFGWSSLGTNRSISCCIYNSSNT